MKKLTEREEEIMQVLWRLEKAFVKDIIPHLPQEYHYNTVSTVVRLLETKGFITHEAFGNTHQYLPKITKQEYSSFYMKSASKRFFNNSYKSMLSFFANEEKISPEELEEILKLIENKKK